MRVKSFQQSVENVVIRKEKSKKCSVKATFFVEKNVEKVEKHLYKMVSKKWKTFIIYTGESTIVN